MTPTSGAWRDELAALVARAARRTSQPADWVSTVARAGRISVGALLLQQSGLVADELLDAGIDDLPEEIAAALARVAPGVDIGSLASYPDVALDGLSNAVKGALFELRVADAVAAGDIPLAPDTTFELVEDFTTPGYDAVLTRADGSVDYVQLKASSTAEIVERHYELHPEVDEVWTTSEAAADAATQGLGGVLDTGITDTALEAAVAALADQASTSFEELLDETLPQVTFAIIAAQSAWQLLQGRSPDAVFADARRRAGQATLTSAVVGLAATVTGTDAVRVPAVLAVSVGRASLAELSRIGGRVDTLTAMAAGLRPRQV